MDRPMRMDGGDGVTGTMDGPAGRDGVIEVTVPNGILNEYTSQRSVPGCTGGPKLLPGFGVGVR